MLAVRVEDYLPVLMRHALRLLPYCLISCLTFSGLEGATGDPVGYVANHLVAGKKGSLAVPLADGYKKLGKIAVSGDGFVEFESDLPLDLLGPALSACLDVRSGPGSGESLQVTGFSGKRVLFEGPPMFPIEAGTVVGVRPNWSIGGLFGSPPSEEILQGDTYQDADVIGLLDPATQTTREFFYQTGEGWREVGHEVDGDRSATAVPYRSAVQFFRRRAPDLQYFLIGTVPMYGSPQQWVRVWPGRNLLTTPFTPARRIGDLLAPESLNSGRSAPRSDSFRIVYADTSLSRILYHHESRGWTRVGGGSSDPADTPVELFGVIDFQRTGDGGFLRFGTDFQSAGAVAAAAVAPENEVRIQSELSNFTTNTLGWQSEPGVAYQVQVQPVGSTRWADLGTPVTATGTVCRKTCRPTGHGIFRVVIR